MDVIKALRKLAGNSQKARTRLRETEWPEAIYAIGDIHGCLDLLKKLEARIIDHAARRDHHNYWIVALGDAVDRGPDSAGVLDYLLDDAPEGARRLCLAGNHEEMMVDFLDAPTPEHRWLQLGGEQTLASYGIETATLWKPEMAQRQRVEVLQGTIPAEHISAIRTMPVVLTLPGLVLVHAGIFQGVPLDQQSDEELMWMRHKDNSQTADDSLPLVVHGHTPNPEPFISRNRICIDTGAYFTGKMTALYLSPGKQPGLLQVS